jgi:hypothetical protein
MRDKVRTFVDFWIQSHVHASGYQSKVDTKLASLLASRCIEMAKSEGISTSDIDAEFGDIVEHINGQIKRVNDDRVASGRDIDRANAQRLNQELEEGLIGSFPASDPVSVLQPSKSKFESR